MAEKKNKKFIWIIAVLLVIIAVLAGRDVISRGIAGSSATSAAVKSVGDVYSLITENPAEVLKVVEQNGLYKVTLKTTLPNGQQTVAEAYVTKDGALIVNNPVNITAYMEQLRREKAFDECLAGKKLAVAGQTTDANTVQQLRVLGNFAYKFYVDCSGANLQMCQQAGIKEIPVTVFDNSSYAGVQPLSFFENLTGCIY